MNHSKFFILLLLSTSIAQANICKDNSGTCGLVFTTIPSIPYLSTGGCDNSNVSLSYTITNQGSSPTALTYTLTEIDDLDDTGAVSFDGGSTCSLNGVLDSNASCDIVLDYQPCVTGDLDWNLTVTPQSPQKPFVLPLEAVVNPVFAYVINTTIPANISYCLLDSHGNFGATVASACSTVDLTFTGEEVLDDPWYILVNQDATYAYISNADGGEGTNISICPIINPTTFGSAINPCFNSTGNGTFAGPTGMALNSDETLLYVVNQGSSGTISICPISGGSLGTCDDSVSGGTQPVDIILSEETGLAYVTNLVGSDGPQGTMRIYTIGDDGSLTLNNTFTDLTFNETTGLSNVGDALYLTNFGNSTVSTCPIDDDTLDACSLLTAASDLLATPTSIVSSSLGSYIANLHVVEIDEVYQYGITRCIGDADSVLCVFLMDPTFSNPSDAFIVQ